MKLKVCGLTKEDHVRYCVRNKVEFCGFILNYKNSHRYISFNKAKKLTNVKKNKTKFVGVLVKPTYNELKKNSQILILIIFKFMEISTFLNLQR